MPRQDTCNRAVFWKPHEVPGLSLMTADFTTHEFAPHWHEALAVGMTEFGGAKIKSRGSVEQAEPSALFVFNPAEPHAGWMGGSRRWCYRALYLTRTGMDAAKEALGLRRLPGFTQNRIADPGLAAAFLKLHRSIQGGTDPLWQWELLLDCLGALCRRHGGQDRETHSLQADRALVQRIMDWMRQRHQEDLRLVQIASAFGMTQYQLIGLFKKTIGLTPHACLIQIRLNAACHLLRNDAPPADAAVATGFYDQSALGRHFKRCYGITPLQYTSAVRH